MRKTVIATGETYHIFNRGVEKRKIYIDNRDYRRFFDLMRYYQSPKGNRFSFFKPKAREELILKSNNNKYIDLISYCLMPNHFHLLVGQLTEAGIKDYLRLISNSYARYFNTRHNRIGGLFQGNFKAVRVEDNKQLLQLSRYIHLNPLVGFITNNLNNWYWSSLREYTSGTTGICNKKMILDQFNGNNSYLNFISDLKDYSKNFTSIENLTLGDNN